MSATRAQMIWRLTHTTCIPVGDDLFRVASSEEAAVIVDTLATEPEKHTRIMDDGAAYCGWTTEAGTFDGCGHAWPCPTVKARTSGQEG